MQKHNPSETALKVAHSVLTLSHTGDWNDRLPPRLRQLTEELMIAAKLRRYTPRVIQTARKSWMARMYRWNDLLLPGMFHALGYRKCYINDTALKAIAAGATQVVILGAGFDTLAMRLAPEFAQVHFFEVDHPATAKAKHAAITELGQPDNVHLLSVDLERTKIPQAMAMDKHWQSAAKTLFIAEGLLMYLRHTDVLDLFQQASSCATKGSQIVFSHCLPAWATGTAGTVGRFMVRTVGEPIQSWVNSADLPEYLDSTPWTVVSGVDSDNRHGIERYAVAELLEASSHRPTHPPLGREGWA